MNISTLRTLATLTTDESLLTELKAEIERAEKADARKADAKAAKLNEYAAAHDVVIGTLADAVAPVTVAELFEACEGELPEGFSKNKISYALRTYWADEVIKTEGKVNTYAIKA